MQTAWRYWNYNRSYQPRSLKPQDWHILQLKRPPRQKGLRRNQRWCMLTTLSSLKIQVQCPMKKKMSVLLLWSVLGRLYFLKWSSQVCTHVVSVTCMLLVSCLHPSLIYLFISTSREKEKAIVRCAGNSTDGMIIFNLSVSVLVVRWHNNFQS